MQNHVTRIFFFFNFTPWKDIASLNKCTRWLYSLLAIEDMLKYLQCSVCVFNHGRLFVTPWTVAHQAPLPMEFLRQEYWSGSPFPPQGIFLTQGSNQGPLHWQADSFTIEQPGMPKLKYLPDVKSYFLKGWTRRKYFSNVEIHGGWE